MPSTRYSYNGSRMLTIMKLDSSGGDDLLQEIKFQSQIKKYLYLQVKSGPMKLQVFSLCRRCKIW